MSDATLPLPSRDNALRQFAAGLRWRHVRGRACSAAMRAVLALSVPAVLLCWLVPSWRLPTAYVVAAVVLPVVALSSLRAWWRGRHVLSAFGRSLERAGDEMSGVRDDLATWLELDARGERSAMLQWLERDVRTNLAPHQKRALAAAARPSIGRWRWIVPVLLLVLLAWLLSAWLQPPWSGALGGAVNQSSEGDNGDGQGAGGNSEEEQPADQEPSGEDPDQPGEQSPPPNVPPVPDKQQEPDKVPDAPAPLLDLPEQRRFVLPEFIGDGPTRRARMRAAEIEQQVGTTGAPPPSRTGSGGDAEQRPKALSEQFDRAAEQALRSRHVPEHERAMVKRFFEALQRAGDER